MSFVKLDDHHQVLADTAYCQEEQVLKLVNTLEEMCGKSRWLSIGRTNIEQGFMALRKGITESFKEKTEPKK